MSSKPEAVLQSMLNACQDHLVEGQVTAAGVVVVLESLMKAAPESRMNILEQFEAKVEELNNA